MELQKKYRKDLLDESLKKVQKKSQKELLAQLPKNLFIEIIKKQLKLPQKK